MRPRRARPARPRCRRARSPASSSRGRGCSGRAGSAGARRSRAGRGSSRRPPAGSRRRSLRAACATPRSPRGVIGGQPRSRPIFVIIALNCGQAASAASCEVAATKPCELMLSGGNGVAGLERGAAVDLGERGEPLGQAADDRERHREPQRPGARRRGRVPADRDPDGQRDPAWGSGRCRRASSGARSGPAQLTCSSSRSRRSRSSFSANSSS